MPLPNAERQRTFWLLLLAGLGVFFAADDQTSVVAVLPAMVHDLGLAQDQFYKAAWIVNGYILGYIVVMPLMGRAADTFGHGRVFALALVLFCAGSAWVALSSDLTTLTIARAVQAVGAGAALPVALAIATSVLPDSQRPLGLGAMAAAAEAGGVLGPLWGGSLTSLAGWQTVFWINLPLCLPLAFALWRLAPAIDTQKRAIDYLGAALLGGSLALLAVALTNDPIQPRAAGLEAALYAGAALLFGGFLLRQTRAMAPILRLVRLARRPLSAALAANGLLGAALLVAMVDVPLFTNTVLDGSALDGGLNLMRLSVTLAAGAVVGGALASRFGLAAVTAAGAVIAGAGYVGMSTWGSNPSFVEMTVPLAVSGLGFGLVIAPLNTAVMDQVEEDERATWAAVLNVTRLLGALIAVALLTSRGLGSFYTEAGLVPLNDPNFVQKIGVLQVDAYQKTFIAAAIVCFVAVVPALMLTRKE